MNHIYLIRLVLLKRPGFQSQKYGMPRFRFSALPNLVHSTTHLSCVTVMLQVADDQLFKYEGPLKDL